MQSAFVGKTKVLLLKKVQIEKVQPSHDTVLKLLQQWLFGRHWNNVLCVKGCGIWLRANLLLFKDGCRSIVFTALGTNGCHCCRPTSDVDGGGFTGEWVRLVDGWLKLFQTDVFHTKNKQTLLGIPSLTIRAFAYAFPKFKVCILGNPRIHQKEIKNIEGKKLNTLTERTFSEISGQQRLANLFQYNLTVFSNEQLSQQTEQCIPDARSSGMPAHGHFTSHDTVLKLLQHFCLSHCFERFQYLDPEVETCQDR